MRSLQRWEAMLRTANPREYLSELSCGNQLLWPIRAFDRVPPTLRKKREEWGYGRDPSVLRQFLHHPEQVGDLGQDGILQNWLIGNEGVQGGYAPHGRIQVLEQLIGDARRDLRAVAPA